MNKYQKINKVDIKQQAVIVEKVEAEHNPFLLNSVIYFRSCMHNLTLKINDIKRNGQSEEYKSLKYSKQNEQGNGGFKNESRGNHIMKCVFIYLYTSTVSAWAVSMHVVNMHG